jgi:hypothetical protein
MNIFTKGITIAAIALSMTACSAVQLETNIASLLSSAPGQAILSALGANGTLTAGIQTVVTAVDNGLASGATQNALKTVCYTLPWADSALDLFGTAAGIDATVISTTDAAVKAFVAGPCTTPPTTLAAAISQGVQLFMNIEGALNANGVPIVVPAASRAMTVKMLHR